MLKSLKKYDNLLNLNGFTLVLNRTLSAIESVSLGALGGCFDGLLASDAIVGWTDADQAEGADVPEVRLLATQAILQSIFWAR